MEVMNQQNSADNKEEGANIYLDFKPIFVGFVKDDSFHLLFIFGW